MTKKIHALDLHAAPVPLEYIPSNRMGDIDFGDEPSLTKQSEADSCDINKIMGQYEKTGLIPHVNRYQGHYSDLGDAKSYHESMNSVIEAQDAFDSLPASIRTRFGNDPALFLDFVSDPDNRPEMEKMGLLPSTGAAKAPDTVAEPVEVPAKQEKLPKKTPPSGDE
jgi:phage internal scaffolding protein